MTSKFRQNKRGATLVETPVALALFIFFLLFPLIDLATIALRSATAFHAAFNAAQKAARAPSFSKDSATGKSAINAAIEAAQDTKSAALTGTDFADGDIKLRIVGLPLNSDPTKPKKVEFTGPVNQPISKAVGVDPDFIYQIEVTINSSVQPLFLLQQKVLFVDFGVIPGLTAPLPLTVTQRQNVEDPSGLLN